MTDPPWVEWVPGQLTLDGVLPRRRLLDLFCGAGGASVGYARAGFDVVGVDLEPHSDYPFPLIVEDALHTPSSTPRPWPGST